MDRAEIQWEEVGEMRKSRRKRWAHVARIGERVIHIAYLCKSQKDRDH
jgi:hypothetical protein